MKPINEEDAIPILDIAMCSQGLIVSINNDVFDHDVIKQLVIDHMRQILEKLETGEGNGTLVPLEENEDGMLTTIDPKNKH